MLHHDRVDKESSNVMYVSIDSVRVIGGVEFKVSENNDMVLCRSLERMQGVWINGNAQGLVNDSRTSGVRSETLSEMRGLGRRN
ncbi:C-terminal binding protein AN-like [Pyrus ussuriensis x Pyrus communis]|uniref:C-terminal binding protein AN-like n=1 Tax=Pyrus ussuriensis x Pyrus communis TaxID=2448454 RepID=A0A5N5IA06_9ROSA|nr:C-terminal binding protein AN-like [Pyrus ussuriensis x Pyrus communis]